MWLKLITWIENLLFQIWSILFESKNKYLNSEKFLFEIWKLYLHLKKIISILKMIFEFLKKNWIWSLEIWIFKKISSIQNYMFKSKIMIPIMKILFKHYNQCFNFLNLLLEFFFQLLNLKKKLNLKYNILIQKCYWNYYYYYFDS